MGPTLTPFSKTRLSLVIFMHVLFHSSILFLCSKNEIHKILHHTSNCIIWQRRIQQKSDLGMRRAKTRTRISKLKLTLSF